MEIQLLQTYDPTFGMILFIIAAAINLWLAILVFRSNSKNATNRIFSLLSLSTILWLTITYVVNVPSFFKYGLILDRLGIFFAAPMSTLFFLLGHTFPSDHLRLSRRNFYAVIGATLLMMALNISPYAFTSIDIVNESIQPQAGIGIIPFAWISTLFSIFAVYFLFIRQRRAEGEEKHQIRIVLTGILIMLSLVIATILIPILFFDSGIFVAFAPVYTLIFLGMTAYAIIEHHLFNLRVVAAEALTIVLWITLFSKIFVGGSFAEKTVDTSIFAASFIFGILLIRSVRREVRQREELEHLTKELGAANDRLTELDRLKSEFLSLASHQVKSPLAVMKGYASLILEGSYGQVPVKLKEIIVKIKNSCEQMVGLVNNLLDLRKIEEGRMQYNFEPVDLNIFTSETIESLRPLAEAKKLILSFHSDFNEIIAKIDGQSFRQVIQNFVDNAIKYTDQGWIKVELKEKATGRVEISVHDSGRGLSREVIPSLFKQFSRDPGVQKSYQGTGLGLYIAKEIVVAHGGEVKIESEGEGKGSTFSVILPYVSGVKSLKNFEEQHHNN